ncbi:Ff.00g114200.m01.CDS01 [Fusarium sp. VM40]|nr:Ff.00g114200.m01.CDS01 [Fusarium sp. VM40]
MRLLSTKKLQFKEFPDDEIPKYAILSHRWEKEELSYRDIQSEITQRDTRGPSEGPLRNKRTNHKIHEFRLMALQNGYEWVWIDTCCIDKSSSAELQESINSMYKWYRESDVCYAYLSDVSTSTENARHKGSTSSKPWIKSFQDSDWFTRGWTLQEMLAPGILVFFDKNWDRCGNRVELQDAIQVATGINATILIKASSKDIAYLRPIRSGRVFSWAANRRTSRQEDRAYSLLGIFNINMPMLYGETDRAFYRLQTEIIEEYEDISMLAWNYTEADNGFAPNGLAKSPSQFQNYQNLIGKDIDRVPYVAFSPRIIARGLQASLKIMNDPYEKRLGYAVLAYERNKKSLVLPVLFCCLTFVRTPIQNECVRFSDPVWIPSRFVDTARPKPICFVRHVETTHLYEPGDGISLGSAVWRDYTTTLTYPTQAQVGSRHFPAVFGRFSTTPDNTEKDYTFVIELAARSDAKRRYVVIVDYRSNGTSIANDMTATVIRCRWPIKLTYAMELVNRRQAGHKFDSCTLLDKYGNAISTREIVCISHFTSLWDKKGLDRLPRSNLPPRNNTEVHVLGCVRRGPFIGKS